MNSGPDVGQLHLATVEQPHRDDLVALGQEVQRSLPARGADEVRDHEDQRPALDGPLPGLQQRRQVGERRGGQLRLVKQIVDESQDLDAAAPRRDGPLHLAAVQDRPDPVAAPRQQPGKGRDEVDQDDPLDPLAVGVPKSTDGLRSSRNQAVISRSSTYSRM